MGEMIKFGVKLAAVLAISAVFAVAIGALISSIGTFSPSTIMGEILCLISAYLPFDANQVFASIFSTVGFILSFLVARKIFGLSSKAFNDVS